MTAEQLVRLQWIATSPFYPAHRSDLAALLAAYDRLRAALSDLLADTQHADHQCGSRGCPVDAARAALADCPKEG